VGIYTYTPIVVAKYIPRAFHSTQQPETGQNGHLIAFFPSYFVFKNENVKVKVKYGYWFIFCNLNCSN
jgi:hypothetical protein